MTIPDPMSQTQYTTIILSYYSSKYVTLNMIQWKHQDSRPQSQLSHTSPSINPTEIPVYVKLIDPLNVYDVNENELFFFKLHKNT